MNLYLVVSAAILVVLGLVWNKAGWLNFCIKATLFGAGLWGCFEALHAFGFIVKL